MLIYTFLMLGVLVMLMVVNGFKDFNLGIDPYFFLIMMEKKMIDFMFVDWRPTKIDIDKDVNSIDYDRNPYEYNFRGIIFRSAAIDSCNDGSNYSS